MAQPPIQPTKPFYESTTFWVNALTLLALFLEQFTDVKIISAFVQDPMRAEAVTKFLLGVLAVVNLLLRLYKTNTQLTFN